MMIHAGLIGASSFGRHHLRAFQNSPHVEAITLAGRNREALEELERRFSKVRAVTTDYHALVADPRVDLVDIVLPHDLHLPVALEAFRQGKHVLVEKPPARTVAEFREMIAAAETARKRLFVVMNLLFTPLHRVVRQAIDAGQIGRPFLSFEAAVRNALGIYQDPDYWRADLERCGGGLQIDGGFHGVYRQLYFLESLGAPRTLVADNGQIGVEMPSKGEDFSTLTLAYESGARIHLMSQWTARAVMGELPSGILGTEGSLVFTGSEPAPLLLRRPGREDLAVAVPEGPNGFAESVTACVEHYVECLATGEEPYAGLDLPLLTLEIITGAYRAAAEGRRVTLETAFRTQFPAGV